MTFDKAAVAEVLEVFDERRSRTGNVLEAAIREPNIEQTIDGASTLEVYLDDTRRAVVRDRNFGGKMWAVFDGQHFELVNIRKDVDVLTLKFEDTIVAALRRRDGKLSIKAGTLTRREFAIKLAKEAKVDYAVDDTPRPKVQRALERSVGGETTDSWEVLGNAAEDVKWRRFSDGHQLVMGGDDWLLERDTTPTRIREFVGGVHNIDFDLDVRRRASQATVTVDVAAWALPPGSVCLGVDLGPADGKWLVGRYSRGVISPRGEVGLVRGRHALKEPKRKKNAASGDAGDPDYPPGQAGTDSGGAASAARTKMVNFALAQQGDAYVYGASGPDAWDCSGLVQEATRAAGHVLAKPSASQWAAVQAAGKTMTVDAALGTRGALLFIQTEDTHHVAISLGNGSTVEARGSAYGTGVFKAASGYTGAGWWV